jgi:hypothetical protein
MKALCKADVRFDSRTVIDNNQNLVVTVLLQNYFFKENKTMLLYKIQSKLK